MKQQFLTFRARGVPMLLGRPWDSSALVETEEITKLIVNSGTKILREDDV